MTSSPLCFINLDSINVTPYFNQYRRCFSCPYDLIYWDRGEHDCQTDAANCYRFTSPVRNSGIHKLSDLLHGYLGFKSFATKVLTQNSYKRVVALTGNTGTLLANPLRSKYRGKYIIDIRDYFLEGLPLYRQREERVIEDAGLAIISSPAYTTFLGEHDFQTMHNIQAISHDEAASVQQKIRPSNPMILASIGTAKNLELDKQVISYFANDERFTVKFIGRGYDALDLYCKENGIRNVKAIGDFSSTETLSFYQDVDAIISMYGNEKTHFKHQLTNKLYYAAQLRLPIIVSPGTYMDETVSKYDMGLALDLERPSEKECILGLYESEITSRRERGISAFMALVKNDNENAMRKITSFLNC